MRKRRCEGRNGLIEITILLVSPGSVCRYESRQASLEQNPGFVRTTAGRFCGRGSLRSWDASKARPHPGRGSAGFGHDLLFVNREELSILDRDASADDGG